MVARLVLELPRRAGGLGPVKPRVKALLIVGVATAALPVVAWTSTFLYWHFRIRGALDALVLRTGGTGMSYIDHAEEFKTLRRAGCRSLPYLVRAVESRGSGELYWQLLDHLFCSRGPGIPNAVDRQHLAGMNVLESNQIRFGDPPDVRRSKVLKIRAWWSAEGDRYHQAWRVWSSDCPR